MNKPAVLITIFTVVVVGGLFLLAVHQSPSASTTTGTPATNPPTVGSNEINFTLKDLNNTPVELSSFKGQKSVFLEFFAVWCPHCQAESSIIDSLYSQNYTKNIQFLQVQASQYGRNYESSGGTDTSPATISDLEWFRDNFHVQYPILQDASITTANKYGVTGYPTIFVINKAGHVVYTNSGEQSQSSLQTAINEALSEN
jgi:cytochrome c-type biogenesis protein